MRSNAHATEPSHLRGEGEQHLPPVRAAQPGLAVDGQPGAGREQVGRVGEQPAVAGRVEGGELMQDGGRDWARSEKKGLRRARGHGACGECLVVIEGSLYL